MCCTDADLGQHCLEVLHVVGEVCNALQVSQAKVGSRILHHLPCQLQILCSHHYLLMARLWRQSASHK